MRHSPGITLPLSALLAVLALPACSGEVTEAPPPTSGTTGAGGALPDGGGAPAACGGKRGTVCDPSAFCAYAPAGSCGDFDRAGICQPRPDTCDGDCPGVCGCDQKRYCNACSAHAAGVDVRDPADCAQEGGTLSAVGLATGVPRFMILKTDPARDVCFRMMVEGFGPSSLEITTPEGWSVRSVEVTDHASDCRLDNGYPAPPAGDAATAIRAVGRLDFTGGFPCSVTVDVNATFDAHAPWVPAVEPFAADALEVSGGCW